MGWYSYFYIDIDMVKNYQYNTENLQENIDDSCGKISVICDVKITSPRLHKIHIEMYTKRGEHHDLEKVMKILRQLFEKNINTIKGVLKPEDGYAASQLY